MKKHNWESALLSIGAVTVQDTIKCLNDSSLQIALLVTDKKVLIGTVTDGDIRRGLINGVKLTDSVNEIFNSEPLVVPLTMSRDMVLKVMRANDIHQVPVVNEEGQVVDLCVLDDFLAPKARPNAMVIMAGGRGLRMEHHTQNCPKPMLEVGGKPMLEHIIELAKDEGFEKFIISVNYLGHMIEDYFGDGEKLKVAIEYIHEQSPLGTAGALGSITTTKGQPIVVTNGDVLTGVKYGELLDFHVRNASFATMAVRQYEMHNPFGVVKTNDGQIVGFEEKPVSISNINAGIYVLNPSELKLLTKEEYCDMPTLFNRIREQNKLCLAYPMHETWMDVGRPDDLDMARANLPKRVLS
ncbi:nucleotidyltransferase family protein [Pseudomonadales bacterium]|nr:nucleotidyltransferase family protein [Pseudomonadales bacterium]